VTKTENILTAQTCQEALMRFWHEQIVVKEKDSKLWVALPLLYPNGLQVVLSINEVGDKKAILSDNGEVISMLFGNSLDIGTKGTNRELLDEKIKAFEIEQYGSQLQKVIDLPLDGIDIHLFGEALVSISHLLYRVETTSPRNEHVYNLIRELLVKKNILFKEKDAAIISGKIEASIRVDFLAINGTELACKTVERRGRMKEYMEIWGYRWRDAKDKHPNLIRSMFYDPENQTWDRETIKIGESVCDIFEPYFNTDRINEKLSRFIH
jgi:hypothetical protein